MTQMFGHHPWTVQDLVSDIHTGRVRLPDIQRPFVWTNAKVRDLIESMYRGYTVGELMFWANKGGDHTKTIGGDAKSQDVSMQVVDGQQRLTSLYAVIRGLKVWREDLTAGTSRSSRRGDAACRKQRNAGGWKPMEGSGATDD